MNEIDKILSVRLPKRGITLSFQERLREFLDPYSFCPSVPADRALNAKVVKDGDEVWVTILAIKGCLGGDVLYIQSWRRVVRYEGFPESDDSFIGAHRGSYDIVTETRRGLDDLPPEVVKEAQKLADDLDPILWDRWREAVQDFLDYKDPADWESLKDDIPDLNPAKAQEELKALL